MRSRFAGLLSAVLLFVALPSGATALSSDLVNWTETWIEFDGEEFVITGFEFDENSVFELVSFDPFIQTDFVLFGLSTSTLLVGAIVEITIPNFFDPLPTKLIDIVFHGSNDGAAGLELPRVLDIIGADAPFFPPPGPALPVVAEFVSATCSSTQCDEHWVMHPNPDFETVKVFIPTGFEFLSMHITTQSVPEPGALALVGGGLLGLLAAGRRQV
jgi:hypothetical protein